MAGLPVSTNPELDTFELALPEFGLSVNNWISYSYNEHFLTPTDGWHFEMDMETASEPLLNALETCPKVQFSINGKLQSTGRVSHHHATGGHNGKLLRIEGKDILGPLVESHIDPSLKFKETQTLIDLLDTVFAAYGLNSFTQENDANLNVITGSKRGPKRTKRGRELKSYKLHKLKPFPKEGAFQFCARVAQRFGLWIWPSADGQTIIVGKPDFEQDAIGKLVRKEALGESLQNNILDGGAYRDLEHQPSVILASGYGAGGNFDKATVRAAVINPAISTNFAPIFKRYPRQKFLQIYVPGIVTFQDDYARPLFLQDDESKTQEQIENFARREMALCTRRALVCKYDVEGHSLNGSPFGVNTILDVDDDVGRVHAPMWVLARTFSKSAGAQGTRSHLELIRPGTLFF